MLVEFVSSYRQLIKKDKNASYNINRVMNHTTQSALSTTQPHSILKDHGEDLLEYVAFRLSEKFKNTNQVFKYFDIKNR